MSARSATTWSVLASRGLVLGWLVVVWVLLWGHLRVDVLLSGVLVGLLVLGLATLPPLPLRSRIRWAKVPRFTAQFALDLLRSAVEVFMATVRAGRGTRSSVIEVRLPPDATDAAVLQACHRISLEPGSLVVDLDRHHDRIFVYQLDTPDEDAAERARDRAQRLVDDVMAMVQPRHREGEER